MIQRVVQEMKCEMQSANVMPIGLTQAEKYQKAYEILFSRVSKGLQERILNLKVNPASRDPEANQFIKEVIAMAEADDSDQ